MDALNHKRANKGRNFVRQWRKYRGLTQQQLAEMTGYTPSSCNLHMCIRAIVDMSNCVIFLSFSLNEFHLDLS